jgi:hypothetical protein
MALELVWAGVGACVCFATAWATLWAALSIFAVFIETAGGSGVLSRCGEPVGVLEETPGGVRVAQHLGGVEVIGMARDAGAIMMGMPARPGC